MVSTFVLFPPHSDVSFFFFGAPFGRYFYKREGYTFPVFFRVVEATKTKRRPLLFLSTNHRLPVTVQHPPPECYATHPSPTNPLPIFSAVTAG